ncbi:MAG: CDGSH iron-sulfur domain-containing protein [Methylovulum sp.]|nr:CDGSH iron-sulfur domain-containing protein [Methylovulum sp.]
MTTKINAPLPVAVEAGVRYSWCSCGHSQAMPLCDHSHRELSEKKSVKFIAAQTETLFLCGCSETQTPPYCDGSKHCDKPLKDADYGY